MSAIRGVYRVVGQSLEQLTTTIASSSLREQTYLGRALGVNPQRRDRLPGVRARDRRRAGAGDRRRLRARRAARRRRRRSPSGAATSTAAARRIVETALRARQPGQSHRADRAGRRRCPTARRPSCWRRPELPLPPLLEPAHRPSTATVIVRQLHASSRSHIYLAVDAKPRPARRSCSRSRRSTCATTRPTSSRFVMEEWVARRIDNRARAEALPADAPAQLPLRRHRIRRRPDARRSG